MRMPYSIMLDAGHGGRDPGAVYQGRQEKDDNLSLVLSIGEILQENGVDVEYTRTTDIYQTPYEKAMIANRAEADFFISIHRNSFPTDNQVSGVESLVYDFSGLKYEMGENINAQLETVGFVNLGVKARPNLVVLKRTQMPAVLVEVGFINSNTDNQLLDENFEAVTQAIARGILDTLEDAGLVQAQEETKSDAPNGERSETEGEENTDFEPGTSPETQADAETGVDTEGLPKYRVQVGAFRNRYYAERMLNELKEQEYPAEIDDTGEFFKVKVGAFSTLNDAVKMEQRLKLAGYSTVVFS